MVRIGSIAKAFDMDKDEMEEFLIENGFAKKNGELKAKWEDDANALKEAISEILEDSEEEEEEENEYEEEEEDERPSKSKKRSKKDEDEEEIDDNDENEEEEELDSETLLNTVKDFEFSSREEIGEFAHAAIDLLVTFNDDGDSDSDEEYEEEEEEEEDPNAPGKYKGWTITKEGIKVIAKKGKKVITTSVRSSSSIRDKIDDVE